MSEHIIEGANAHANRYEEVLMGNTLTLPGVSDPVILTWDSTYLFQFDHGDLVAIELELPHSYAEGTDLIPHVHWTPHAVGVAESGHTVNWRFDYKVAPLDGVFSAVATIDLTDTCLGVNGQAQKANPVGGAVISGSGLTISSVLKGVLYRLAGDTFSTVLNQRPALVHFGLHALMNSHGSASQTKKWSSG